MRNDGIMEGLKSTLEPSRIQTSTLTHNVFLKSSGLVKTMTYTYMRRRYTLRNRRGGSTPPAQSSHQWTEGPWVERQWSHKRHVLLGNHVAMRTCPANPAFTNQMRRRRICRTWSQFPLQNLRQEKYGVCGGGTFGYCLERS